MPSRWLQHLYWPIGAVALATVFISGCQLEPDPSTQNTNPWLEHISQDTPVLIANEIPLEDAEFDRLAQTIQPLLSASRRPDISRLATAQNWRSAGLNPNGFWAVYVNNERLIARIPLLDETAFWNTWVTLNAPPPIQQAHLSSSQQETSAQRAVIKVNSIDTAWSTDLGLSNADWLVVETHGSWLSVWLQETNPNELAPPAELSPTTDQSANPDHWSAVSWNAFNQTHDLDGKVSGYVNLTGLMARKEHSDPSCQQAWSELGAQMPRLIMGSQHLSPEAMTLLTRVVLPTEQTDPPMPQPSIDISEARLAKVAGLGLVVDVATTRQIVLDRLQQSQTALEDCQGLFSLEQSRRWVHGLGNRPVPPIITSIEGVMMRFDGLKTDTREMVAHYLTEIHLPNPQFLIGLASLFAPELASLDLRPNQPPKALPARLVEALGGVPIYLSTTEASLRFGSATELAVPEDVARSGSKALPWASGVINLKRLDELSSVIGGWPITRQGQSFIDELKDWGARAGVEQVQWLIRPTDQGIDVIINTQH